MNRLAQSKSKVDVSVDISGHVRCSDEFLKMMYSRVAQSGTLHDLNHELNTSSSRLKELDIFASATADVTLSKPDKGSDVSRAVVHVKVVEKGPFLLKFGANVKPNTGTLLPGNELATALRNPVGMGETVTFSKDDVPNRQATYTLSGRLPSENYDWTSTVQSGEDVGAGSDMGPIITRRKAEITAATLDGVHRFSAGLCWRDEAPRVSSGGAVAANQSSPLYDMSPESFLGAQASTTTSLKWTSKVFNSLDRPLGPTSGAAVNTELEVALPPGTSLFVRALGSFENHVTWGRSIFGARGLSFSTSATVGALLPFGRSVSPVGGLASMPTFAGAASTLSDRFHLGGYPAGPYQPGLRGFGARGCGPRSCVGGEATGGDYMGTILLSASAPVPHPSLAKYLRTMAFLNVGTIGGAIAAASPSHILRNARASVGAGVTLELAPVRIGFSYGLPILKASHDSVCPWQLGLALEIA